MVDEKKREMRKIENPVGCQMKVDVTSKKSTDELIRALLSKYKSDLSDVLHLHRLEFLHDVMESAEEKEQISSKEQGDVKLKGAEDIDKWRHLMTISKAYYPLEHPNAKSLMWKQGGTNNKFSGKDLVEWRAAQLFRLISLEDWALGKEEKGKFSLDVLLLDDRDRMDDSRFHTPEESEEEKKQKMPKLGKKLPPKPKRPFKFKDESIEDWTESYSDDSEEPGADEYDESTTKLATEWYYSQVEKVPEILKEPEESRAVLKAIVDESEPAEESSIAESFSSLEI